MDWTSEIEQRFTELRLRELNDVLTDVEKLELDHLFQKLRILEEQQAFPVVQKMDALLSDLSSNLKTVHTENLRLIELTSRQALLVADAKRWLGEFERRYAFIETEFQKLTETSILR